jgi:hypothetical protein
MKHHYFWMGVSVAMLTMPTGCQQIADEEGDTAVSSATSTVNVSTRASEGVSIEYPVYIYAFDSQGALTTMQTLYSADTPIALSLPVGSYKIVAVAGASDGYTLPTLPRLTDAIAIADDGLASSALMMGKAEYEVTKTGKNAQLEIQLAYQVSSFSIALHQIPEEVTAVQVSLSSFYTSLTFDGEYGSGGKSVALDCTQSDDGSWQASERYLFPSSTSQTLYSITMTSPSTTQTNAYTYASPLKAGSRFDFVGNYNGDCYIGGTLVVNGWNETVNVEFTFGGGSGSTSGSDTNAGTATSSIPQVGDIYENGIVVSTSNVTSSSADLLLLSLMEWSTTVAEAEGHQESYRSSTGQSWRIPQEEDARAIFGIMDTETREKINAHIQSSAGTYDELSVESKVRYLCIKDEDVYSYRMESDSRVTKAGTSRSYLLRLVRDAHYTGE